MADLVTNGLVGYWNSKQGFDIVSKKWSNLAPSTLTQFDGKIIGDVTLDSIIGGARFTRDDINVQSILIPTFEGVLSNEMTIEFFGKKDMWEDRLDSGSFPDWITFGNAYYIFFNVKGYISGNYGYSEWIAELITPPNLTTGDFYTITANKTTGIWTLYQNGILVNLFARDTLFNFAQTMSLSSPDKEYVVNGIMDNIRVYNRVLTAEEVAQNFVVGREIGLGASQNDKIGEMRINGAILPMYTLDAVLTGNQLRTYHPIKGISCFELVPITDTKASPIRVNAKGTTKAIKKL